MAFEARELPLPAETGAAAKAIFGGTDISGSIRPEGSRTGREANSTALEATPSRPSKAEVIGGSEIGRWTSHKALARNPAKD